MYEVMSIGEGWMDRFISLRNVRTNVTEACFDYSMAIDGDNFEFMKAGSTYHCKIVLFGDTHLNGIGDRIECTILDKSVKIGNCILMKVLSGQEIYYVYPDDVKIYSSAEKFIFEYTRKDLVQVNNVIHADLLD
ncbi:hypothetical protein [Lactiplantibacillus herbarum]|uniref:hypothetical protein n=1 Tax=Lactiplantibacillus herbarum TaxID=1670446 RepID=UPI00064E2438|nr:hypothetical protein [Lactiplantibacillus herbarum]